MGSIHWIREARVRVASRDARRAMRFATPFPARRIITAATLRRRLPASQPRIRPAIKRVFANLRAFRRRHAETRSGRSCLMMHHPSSQVILLGQLGFAALIATFNGAGPAAMVEMAPSRVRCTVVSVGLNLVYGVVCGLTPMIAIYTIKRSGDDLAPAYLLLATASRL